MEITRRSKRCEPCSRTARRTGNITPNGYRRIKVGGRLYLEHRWVMEQYLGRKLLPTEVVHHLNEDRLDNRIENLELKSSHSEHLREHQEKAQWRCIGCGTTFRAKPCEKKRFCSRSCYFQAGGTRGHGRHFPPATRVA